MTAHIQIVGFNHREHLASCLRSCLAQTVTVPVLYIDNASADGSAECVAREFPAVRLIRNATNRGYSGGHNQGIRAHPESDVVIVLNPDVVLEPDFVEKGVAGFSRPEVGAVAPLLLRPPAGSGRVRGSDILDAYGTVLLKSLRAVNQFEGVPTSRLPALDTRQVWGFTGAAAFLRRAALDAVALAGEIFDQDLFAYREDVDLSWRLRLCGWDIVGSPVAYATHLRAAKRGQKKPARLAQLSWRNYYLVLVKNAPLKTLLRSLPFVLAEDVAREIQLFTHPRLWPALPELLRLLPKFLGKRSLVVHGTREVPPA